MKKTRRKTSSARRQVKTAAPLTSMTGFASVRGRVGDRRFLLEAKSVNHRFCEVSVRLPGKYSAWELAIQNKVRERFQRGRFDIFVREEGGRGLKATDLSQFRQAHQQLKRLANTLRLQNGVSLETLLNFKQNYFREEENFDPASEWALFQCLVDNLLSSLEKMRRREGKQLNKWFRQHLNKMQQRLRDLKRLAKIPPRLQRERLGRRLEELGLIGSDKDERLIAEIALICDKLDITEELVRLECHMDSFRKILIEGGLFGRKIDFLMQEVGREINTIASKSQDSAISSQAVEFKAEIEQIREQAGNVE